jgi:hypothetical protein
VGLYAALEAPLFHVTAYIRGTLPSAAEAGVILAAFVGTAEAVPFPIKIKGKIKVKGDGQECPPHTIKVLNEEFL